MGATVTPAQGYLAGIFRTPDILVGAARREQLMLNPGIDAEALTSWTDDTGGTASVTATAAKGWEERSWGVVMADAGDGVCGISQVVTLDDAITAAQEDVYIIHASVWAKFELTGKTATLKVTGLSAADADLGNGSVTILSEHPYYGDTEWGYFSVSILAKEDMKKVKLEIYSNAGGAQEWYIDNIQAYVLDEIAGAYGDMALDQNTLLENISTYATIGSHGEHVFYPASEEPAVLEVPSFYIATESFAVDMQDGDRVFVILYTKRGTKTAARWEFFAYIKNVGITVPGKSFIKESASLQLTGIVGFADR